MPSLFRAILFRELAGRGNRRALLCRRLNWEGWSGPIGAETGRSRAQEPPQLHGRAPRDFLQSPLFLPPFTGLVGLSELLANRVWEDKIRDRPGVAASAQKATPRGSPDTREPGEPTRDRGGRVRRDYATCSASRDAIAPAFEVGAWGSLPCCPASTPPLTFPPPPSTRRPAAPPTRPFPYQHPRPRQRRRRRTAPRRRHFVSEPVERLNRARSCFFGGSGSSGSRCGRAEPAWDAGWPERWSGGGAGAAGGVARRMISDPEPKNKLH